MSAPHASQGFGLLELLVTLLLTSTALLGMIAMQGQAIRHVLAATQQQKAIFLANDLLEQFAGDPAWMAAHGFAKLPAAACGSGALQPMAQRLACWAQAVESELPGARALEDQFHLCHSTTPGLCNGGSLLELQLAWHASGAGCTARGTSGARPICHYRLRTAP
ncbi:hypothetical protein [Stutzerimonas kirkiae]|uniref:Type IV pilus modification protein PilV n=1 Tax=Stutzerimonas kirkiae TaxID=2211392 RepID=A0A4Q9RA04_9GAMM|nr:hypothetical protein [Stutzerimonas kirkiae]TBU97363.1 hypothetical protein DNJ96_08675 [Stutzerimonas kirkiae]TBV00338.1 hypothetical protein DNJ95_15025 [Stutzerimonas kirkiae]TBV05536.1 hypothetical protein DNK08_15880 [Stutzerimonas kirkiae]TBV10518.1 hypothetical protein DNK01_17645 [Stutzerimonas kirkiae]